MRGRTPIARALAALGPMLPRPWSGSEFIRRVAEQRGRTIVLLTIDLGYDSPNGVWIALPDVDLIGVPKDTSGDRLATIICHEVAHMVLRHEPQEVMSKDVVARILAPDLSPSLVARYMGRHDYAPAPERDAETLATKLLAEIRTLEANPAVSSPLGRFTDQLL